MVDNCHRCFIGAVVLSRRQPIKIIHDIPYYVANAQATSQGEFINSIVAV
jgi:hypothetical protein